MDTPNTSAVARPKPAPLPATQDDLLARKTMMAQKNLNDEVDEIHFALWSDQSYQDYLDAVYDEQAIEGSLAFDDSEAARAIRTYAQMDANRVRYPRTAREKLAIIAKALHVVLRRYHISRKERRMTIGGETVSGANND